MSVRPSAVRDRARNSVLRRSRLPVHTGTLRCVPEARSTPYNGGAFRVSVSSLGSEG